MWFSVDESKPIYQQLRDFIENRILQGELKPGDGVPSVRKLSQELKINPQTILNAFNKLVDGGIIFKKRGMGMFVAEQARERIISQKKENYLKDELPGCLKKGALLGIEKDELLEIIDTCWEE